MSDTDAKLVRMANQIATFFETQPERAEGVAKHLNDFWDPRMRTAFGRLLAAGGSGLHPLVLEAAPAIRIPAA
ncbi:formate dehydrogenase subunit delta [Frigidibacter sp. MR17.14]|uniref:formate dehydrogenase subunit delta n=1 Tax=Frigidibacter sp. MR17.14 TaxID=3126509 RepID=UPI003012AED6